MEKIYRNNFRSIYRMVGEDSIILLLLPVVIGAFIFFSAETFDARKYAFLLRIAIIVWLIMNIFPSTVVIYLYLRRTNGLVVTVSELEKLILVTYKDEQRQFRFDDIKAVYRVASGRELNKLEMLNFYYYEIVFVDGSILCITCLMSSEKDFAINGREMKRVSSINFLFPEVQLKKQY